jgi:EAL domain-containing protein (putative c-di-GMP-specific phosphodiesterase class I)/FixJ family two-component response regulator
VRVGSSPTRPVLVADDDESVRSLWRSALEGAGFDVVEAADGPACLEVVTSMQCSAVVLDNRMPEYSGLEVLKRLRSSTATAALPVIMVTGHGDVVDRVRALEDGATDYLVKPVAPAELVARVRAQIRLQLAWRHIVDTRLEERARVLDALSKLRPSEVVEATADAVCGRLVAIDRVAGAAVLGFVHDAIVVPLAVHLRDAGALIDPRAIRGLEAERIRFELSHGPWIDESGRVPWAGGAMWQSVGTTVTVYAAFGPVDHPLGALSLAVEPVPGMNLADAAREHLSATLDFAAMAGVLLAPAMEARVALANATAHVGSLLDDRAFSPAFQPIIDLDDGTIVGFEALARFFDGTPPDVQLAEARRVGMHLDLEQALLDDAVARARVLAREGLLFLNASPAFVIERGHLLDTASLRDLRAVLEVTEHERVDDYRQLRSAIDRLRPEVQVCVDDAGAGYASLRHVLALAPEFMKLDSEWVRGLSGDVARQALVAGLASFADSTGTRLIAEGIETEEELAAVRRLGIRLGQGYLLGRPITSEPLRG